MYTQCIYIHSGRALTHKTKQNLRDRDRVRNKRGLGEKGSGRFLKAEGKWFGIPLSLVFSMVRFFLGEPNQALINNGVRHDLGGRDRGSS